ncbi:hypothetical protein UFOVP328_331 [uncultured Caudovirales phage]|uniref:Uncharacterized protein n=1 Tax=uncultured Caudovirales phage TaxID=2100421 RepID=A0A6J5LUM8_9CAUD|nr:hypothetical protein UFOVP328_331 [uncultured Caudovirales phage]
MQLHEGGNIFKDASGRALTQRINQTDVKSTIAWLEQLTGLELQDNTLGSTGRKATSGDLDLAVDANQITKDQLVQHLTQWAQSHGLKPEEYIRKSGISVHLKTPINGRPDQGHVQTDFMFLKDVPFSKFILSAPGNSNYRGQDRNVLMNSIAKSMGYKLNQTAGLQDRATNEIISNDPDQIAKILLNKSATRNDLHSVETIIAALAQDPKKDDKLKDAREHFAREGVPFMEGMELKPPTGYTEVNFLAKLRDRIVNQGMVPLVESQQLTEAAARIEHLEDLVFEKGTRGIREALDIIKAAAENTAATTTVKWDGKPAIIFGRKPTGEFVLTDKSGFLAKGYDGMATSPDMLARIQNMRSGERGELIGIYTQLWPMLEQATPQNFRGYIQGDLLYTSQPPEQAGAYVFKPNFIEYRIPVTSKLGQAIGNSEVGIAIHTRYDDAQSQAEPIQNIKFNPHPGLLLIEPTVKDIQNVAPSRKLERELRSVVAQNGAAIDSLFNPAELRAAGITDLPQLCKRYINSRIHTNYDNLLSDFGPWLQTAVTPRKYNNIVEYLQSPSSNLDGISAAFTSFLLLHEIKTDMLNQLDRQQPGQEGWVIAAPAGRAKLVNRFGFSAGNRILNNPNLG